MGQVGGDVHGAVAHPDHEHPLVAEVLGGPVVERVQLAAGEVARVGRIGPRRYVVVAVGHHQRVRPLSLATLQLQLPAAALRGPGVHDSGAEPDPVVQTEALGVVLEVAAHRVTARVVRGAGGHRQFGELGPRPAGDQVQRAVGGGRPVLQAPDAADPRRLARRPPRRSPRPSGRAARPGPRGRPRRSPFVERLGSASRRPFDQSCEAGATRPVPSASAGRARPGRRYAWRRAATWRSGYAAACKAVYTGSIPVVAFSGAHTFRAGLVQSARSRLTRSERGRLNGDCGTSASARRSLER